jgi:hexokinase
MPPLPDITKSIEPYFLLTDERLHDIVKHFRQELEEGLASYGHDVAMVPSFVPAVPNGSEVG